MFTAPSPSAHMTTAQTNEVMFALIERSGLLTCEQLAPYRSANAAANALDLMRALVSDRMLTPFQARQLLRGKYRGYFLTEKYKVLERIGEGGMGHVLLCEHLLLQKLVALKLLSASWVHVPGAEERFMREARAAAALDHPNIVRVFDADRAAGIPFMVMEYVDGKNLHQLIAEHGPLSPVRAAEYIRQAAVGLAAAHRVGLVHRDIKPGNLLLDRSGVVKILDLGLARFLVDSARNHNLTQRFDAGTVLGTVDFIAPEQADNSSTVDIRADIYSLGHTMYYLLTGKMPFGDGSAAQKLMWHQMREPEPLTSRRPEVPAELQAIFEKMTRKNPIQRYQNPAEVAAALRPLITGPVAAPPPEHMPKLRPGAFLLGLSPSPTPEMIAGAINAASDPSTPPNTSSNTSRMSEMPRQGGSDVFRTGMSVPLDPTDGSDPLPALPTPQGTAPLPVPPRRRWPLIGGVALLAVLAGLVGWQLAKMARTGGDYRLPDNPAANPTEPTEPTPPTQPGGPVLTGSGSSFVNPIMQQWAKLYQEKTGVAVKYDSTGSSKGVRAFTDKHVMFGCTDAYLTQRELQTAEGVGGPVAHVPLVMGAVVVTYNLPTVKEPLNFSAGVLVDIYLGRIKTWNDPAIMACNPGVELPPTKISVIHRKDGSGTTYIWTDYLSQVSGDWRAPNGPGADTAVKWPLGTPAEKNDGVAREVRKTVGAIGYVELNFALAQSLKYGRVQNAEGEYILPTLESVTAAADGKVKDIPDDLRFTLTDAPGKGAYPIAGTTWAVVYKEELRKDKQLREFLLWAVHGGQEYAAKLHYAPLPPVLVKRIDTILDSKE